MRPEQHPQRALINDEVHARPSSPLPTPARVSYLALVSGWSERDTEWQHVCALATRFYKAPPPPGANHYSADLGPFRLVWERHTEFARYTFLVPGPGPGTASTALAEVPPDWVKSLPGQTLVAAHVTLITRELASESLAKEMFGANVLIGCAIAGGAATAWTDFRIQPDGFSRLLVQDLGMTPNQAGRNLQRLLEIETYRMMALLALPVARDLTPQLTRYERELAEITANLAEGAVADEPVLLDRLTRLEAEIENREAENHYRFNAAAAYYDLVQTRIVELREGRIEGLQTFREFTERRLAPAMNTCRAVAARQESLSQRVSRATQLLSTRVDLTRERQNQAVLASLDNRARQQLRLQATVEALSIAAVSYYIVGLIGYLAKGARVLGMLDSPALVQGLSVPVVLLVTAFLVRKIRRMVTRSA
ncbi:MAG: DUF3422 domain-containing protein [Gammaproteobacteria bacterium]